MTAHLQEGRARTSVIRTKGTAFVRRRGRNDTETGQGVEPRERTTSAGRCSNGRIPGERQRNGSKGKAEGCKVGWVRGVSCVWWEDVQISSKRKAIDMKVASHMIKGARNRKNGQKEGTIRNERCGGSETGIVRWVQWPPRTPNRYTKEQEGR